MNELKEGDIVRINQEEVVYADTYRDRQDVVRTQIKLGGKDDSKQSKYLGGDDLRGQYVVHHIVCEGYPDGCGYRSIVFCQKLDNSQSQVQIIVDNKWPQSVGRATLKYTKETED